MEITTPNLNGQNEIAPASAEDPVQPLNIQSKTTGNNGLSQAELSDPNEIKVTVADQTTPIVILFGPPACGKTMTLVRLTRYLKEKNYEVQPVTSFRPSYDTHYGEMCKIYHEMIDSDKAAQSTSNISFMLVRILDENKHTVCQILEAPGEYYYDPDAPSNGFPRYINSIISNSNRKIWCFMIEPSWKDEKDRRGYVSKIASLRKQMRSSDKVLFVYNKIDLTPFVRSPGQINIVEATKDVENLYPGIFAPFKTKMAFWTSNNFKFVPFQTGSYHTTDRGGFAFESGPDEYPRDLWKKICKYVKG